jgi:hypothetical protein
MTLPVIPERAERANPESITRSVSSLAQELWIPDRRFALRRPFEILAFFVSFHTRLHTILLALHGPAWPNLPA